MSVLQVLNLEVMDELRPSEQENAKEGKRKGEEDRRKRCIFLSIMIHGGKFVRLHSKKKEKRRRASTSRARST
jgi:hypothetical protein